MTNCELDIMHFLEDDDENEYLIEYLGALQLEGHMGNAHGHNSTEFKLNNEQLRSVQQQQFCASTLETDNNNFKNLKKRKPSNVAAAQENAKIDHCMGRGRLYPSGKTENIQESIRRDIRNAVGNSHQDHVMSKYLEEQKSKMIQRDAAKHHENPLKNLNKQKSDWIEQWVETATKYTLSLNLESATDPFDDFINADSTEKPRIAEEIGNIGLNTGAKESKKSKRTSRKTRSWKPKKSDSLTESLTLSLKPSLRMCEERLKATEKRSEIESEPIFASDFPSLGDSTLVGRWNQVQGNANSTVGYTSWIPAEYTPFTITNDDFPCLPTPSVPVGVAAPSNFNFYTLSNRGVDRNVTKKCRILAVENFSKSVSLGYLENFFRTYGPIESVSLESVGKSVRVHVKAEEQVLRSIKRLDGQHVAGMDLSHVCKAYYVE